MSDNFSIVLVAAAALIDADNRILIQKRPPGKPHAGRWEFPGGKLEAGETPEAALVRELAEELGVTTLEKALFPLSFISWPYPPVHMVMPLYGCRNWTGMPQPHVAQELAWVRPARLADYDLLESNAGLIATLQALV